MELSCHPSPTLNYTVSCLFAVGFFTGVLTCKGAAVSVGEYSELSTFTRAAGACAPHVHVCEHDESVMLLIHLQYNHNSARQSYLHQPHRRYQRSKMCEMQSCVYRESDREREGRRGCRDGALVAEGAQSQETAN